MPGEARDEGRTIAVEVAKKKKAQYYKEWRERNKEKYNQYDKEYRQKNREKLMAREASWRETNREKIREKDRQRNAKVQDWLAEYRRGKSCVDCGKIPGDARVLEFDHVRGNKKYKLSYVTTIKKAKEEVTKCELRCVNCHRIATKNRRQAQVDLPAAEKRTRDWIDEYKLAAGCVVCGYTENACALDARKPPGIFKDRVSRIRSLSTAKQVLPKCTIVCANCSRMLSVSSFG